MRTCHPRIRPGSIWSVPDLSSGERIASGVDGLPLGLGPGGAWVAFLDESAGGEHGPALAAVDLPAGTTRTLVPPMDPPLATIGEVAPDGRVAVAQEQSSSSRRGELSNLLIVERDGTYRNVTNGVQPSPTAFAWADPDVVAKARTYAAVVGPAPRANAPPPPTNTRPGQGLFLTPP